MTTSRILRLATLAVAVLAPVAFAPRAFAQNTPPSLPPQKAAQGADTSAAQVDRIAAVVGDRPILWTEVMEEINERRARGLKPPPDSAGQMELARGVIQEMIDEEAIV